MKQNKRYLDNYDLTEAIDLYLADIKEQINLETEWVATTRALGFISAKAVYAKVSSPNYNASAMDGIAINSASSALASEYNPIILDKSQYQYVNTGDVIREIWDAVIMIEDVIFKEDDSVMITKAASYFENIRPIGEDITQTQMIIPSFHKIRAVDLGPLIASKNKEIEVFRKLTTTILPTGSEIVDIAVVKEVLKDGMIIDSNSSMIQGLAEDLNLYPHVLEVCTDGYEQIKAMTEWATNSSDLLLIIAGSSAGSKDYTAKVIEELGEVSVHGIAIKPGKPAILGIVNETIVIGLPGYPASAYIVFEQIVKPVINRLFHQKNTQEVIPATLTKTIYSSLKHLEFVRVKVGHIDGRFVCTPLARGAGISMSLALADGIVSVVKQSEGYQKNEIVDVRLLKPISYLMNQITSIGSHDLILDVFNDVFNERDYSYTFSSSHVGSYSGLVALKNRETLIAPIHLLAEDGTYNVEVVRKLFKGERMALIKGVKRKQVLAYAKGNPLKISCPCDIVIKKLKYVNRQSGSGTAVLFDYLLKERDFDKKDVLGYDFIVPTHFNVAAAIKNNTADCGLLIKSIADVMGLGYFEVMAEDYDFVLYEKDLEQPKVKSLIEVLRYDFFRRRLLEFDCYDTADSGEVIVIGEVE